jgi:hypothetical protein
MNSFFRNGLNESLRTDTIHFRFHRDMELYVKTISLYCVQSQCRKCVFALKPLL